MRDEVATIVRKEHTATSTGRSWRIAVGAQSSRDIGPGKEDEDTRANCDSDL